MKLPESLLRKLVIANAAFIALVLVAGLGSLIIKLPTKLSKLQVRAQGLVPRDPKASSAFTPVVEHFELKVDPMEARQIEELVARIRQRGVLTDADKIWFPASFYHQGIKYKAKIRIRGDLKMHWAETKRSWRVKFSKGNPFRGLREINLVLPQDKNYENEFLAYELGKQAGLLIPEHGYASLKINNVNMGGYLWLEQWDRSGMVKRGMPRGEIFGENNTWVQAYEIGLDTPMINTEPSAYKEMTRASDEIVLHQDMFHRFLSLVFQGSNEQLLSRLPDYLDIEKYLRWNAITWVFNSTHSHWGDNLRWFHNPTSERFEPILYDVNMYPFPAKHLGFESKDSDPLAQRLFRDPQMALRRNRLILHYLKWMDEHSTAFIDAHWAVLGPLMSSGIGKDTLTVEKAQRHRNEHQRVLDDIAAVLKRQIRHGRLFATLDATDGTRREATLRLLPESLTGISDVALNLPVASTAMPSVAVYRQGVRQEGLKTTLEQGNNGLVLRLGFNLTSDKDASLSLLKTPWELKLHFKTPYRVLSQTMAVEAVSTATGAKLPDDKLYSVVQGYQL